MQGYSQAVILPFKKMDAVLPDAVSAELHVLSPLLYANKKNGIKYWLKQASRSKGIGQEVWEREH